MTNLDMPTPDRSAMSLLRLIALGVLVAGAIVKPERAIAKESHGKIHGSGGFLISSPPTNCHLIGDSIMNEYVSGICGIGVKVIPQGRNPHISYEFLQRVCIPIGIIRTRKM